MILVGRNDESEWFSFFYEKDDFFFYVNVGSNFPFRAPGRLQGSLVFYRDYGKPLLEWAKMILPERLDIKSVDTKPGEFYPRMWRGEMANLDSVTLAGMQSILSKSIVAAELIVERLFDLFTYVEPTKHNQSIYGYKIREALLLSCMENESAWAGILRANGYNVNSVNLTTKDYVKLLGPLQLDKYDVRFPMYTEIGTITPYSEWTPESPTQSLPWYSAYNNTKHNREDNLDKATIASVIDSVAALAIMLCAQFGPSAVPRGLEVSLREIHHSWPYVPLGNATRNINSDGSTQGIQYNLSSTWTPKQFSF